jgi:DNA polymerase-3 subunit delta'
MNPSEQIQLYGLDKYFYEITNLYNAKKMPNKILLSGKKGSGKSTMTYHIVNYILSKSEKNKYNIENFSINRNNKSFLLVQNKTHPNFYLIELIDEKKNIDVAQIREMINYTNKSSFNNLPRFIVIDNIENLNKNSSNALLKIIEDPNDNIFFILIHNSNKKILPTLKSRCLTFNINLSFNETLNICNFLLKSNLLDLINNDLINYYNGPGDFINLINFAKEKKIDLKNITLVNFLHYLINNNFYKKNTFIKNLIVNNIELYFLKTYKISKGKNKILDIYHNFIRRVYETNTYNLDEESLFMEFQTKIING